MFRYLVKEPVQRKSPALFWFRACQMLHVGTNGWSDIIALEVLRRFRPKVEFPPSKLFPDDNPSAIANGVKGKGYFVSDRRLPADLIETIKKFAFSTPAYADDPTKPIRFSQQNIPTDQYRWNWRLQDVTANSAVSSMLCDSYFHRIAQEYLQCRPLLTSVSLWVNPVCPGTHPANLFHYDNDGPAFLKCFIYLTDVTETTGPHVFIDGTHAHVKPKRFAQSRRYEEQELLECFGSDKKQVFIGPAGTMIFEDTMGFHRGSEVHDSYRLLLQLEYGLVDIPHVEEFTVGIRTHPIPGLHDSIRKVVKKFYH